MKRSALLILLISAAAFSNANAQVQVRNEPRHKNVFENKYIRILDVNIQPHDTTMFHVHSTPSVFLVFTNTITGTQIKGQNWTEGKNVPGYVWYRSFLNDTLVHRVSNIDKVPFHVTDIEILSGYNNKNYTKPLPFRILFENEKAVAYRLTDSSINKKVISNRGPIIAGLVTGDDIILHDTKSKRSVIIKANTRCTYIAPGTSFYLSTTGKKPVDLVLFEIK
ncbi:MAG TPA: hypothetical protein VK668_21415 [Mucilaginibacter sp.]|nr:hypothetical protein [Mucilaginibacter sp.]